MFLPEYRLTYAFYDHLLTIKRRKNSFHRFLQLKAISFRFIQIIFNYKCMQHKLCVFRASDVIVPTWPLRLVRSLNTLLKYIFILLKVFCISCLNIFCEYFVFCILIQFFEFLYFVFKYNFLSILPNSVRSHSNFASNWFSGFIKSGLTIKLLKCHELN